jgi:hypothetical protein
MACFVVVTDVQREIRPEVTGKVWEIVESFPFLDAEALSASWRNCTLAEHATPLPPSLCFGAAGRAGSALARCYFGAVEATLLRRAASA